MTCCIMLLQEGARPHMNDVRVIKLMSLQSSVGVSMVITVMVDWVIFASVRCTDWCLLIYLPMYSWYHLCYHYIFLDYSILD